MNNIVLTILLSAIIVLTSFTPVEVKQYKLRTVVIDAGHGGKDPGCLGKNSHEAEITLATALELGRIIKENLPDVKVIYTRTKNEFVELHDRAGIANRNNADLFISIHCNSGPKHVFGTETYTMGLHTTEDNLEVAKRENSVILKESNYKKNYQGFDPSSPQAHILFSVYQNAFIENSLRFAQKVEKQFSTRIGRTSRGVKQAGLVVLWKSAMPSVLIEIGFLTNPAEEKFLKNKTSQVYMASGIYRALKEYKSELESMNK
ncbi:N-acetylmuramoyl-L-alanine amidase family protein [Sporocytophaga myxococcoides]|uniref:N-acetylmuramoyl-L-alanine amidase family protein n=1 Tax=Sporocytophaga myxococcoides TaxID=153721 RepID=UPI0005EDAB8C|nr:N-acetylmuramoyl-L-alanine amidase [Sporocytophaga myxococcoides]